MKIRYLLMMLAMSCTVSAAVLTVKNNSGKTRNFSVWTNPSLLDRFNGKIGNAKQKEITFLVLEGTKRTVHIKSGNEEIDVTFKKPLQEISVNLNDKGKWN